MLNHANVISFANIISKLLSIKENDNRVDGLSCSKLFEEQTLQKPMRLNIAYFIAHILHEAIYIKESLPHEIAHIGRGSQDKQL